MSQEQMRSLSYLIGLCVFMEDSRIDSSSQQIVGSSDGMDVSRQVKVELQMSQTQSRDTKQRVKVFALQRGLSGFKTRHCTKSIEHH